MGVHAHEREWDTNTEFESCLGNIPNWELCWSPSIGCVLTLLSCISMDMTYEYGQWIIVSSALLIISGNPLEIIYLTYPHDILMSTFVKKNSTDVYFQ
jgi:hypothetical protein